MSTELSTYQKDILDWVANGKGNLIVKATAGSGKTFICRETSILIARNFPNASAKYLAFGKLNAVEAQKSFAIDAGTFHSMGFKALGAYFYSRRIGYVKTDPRNNDTVLDALYGRDIDAVRAVVSNLASKVKGENLDHNVTNETLGALCERFAIETSTNDFTYAQVFDFTRALLAECANLEGISKRKTIDFDDQLWLLERFDITLPKWDFLLVDEAQDTNVIQRCVIRRSMSPTSRLIAVGDDCQAIYGFRGATSDALDVIASEFSCTSLPLSISYRCSSAVVAYAKNYGIIEPSPTAVAGAILTPATYNVKHIPNLDLILCRNTAPLITLAYRCITNDIPVQIRGRDIGAGLIAFVKKLAGRRTTASDLEQLPAKVEAFRTKETERANLSRNDQKAQSVNDRCDSLLALIDSMTPAETMRGIPGLTDRITRLFSDENRCEEDCTTRHTHNRKVVLATVHKAKGLEANHVGILDANLMPSKYAKTTDAKRQETNIQFVAYTRARLTMTFLSSETIATL